MKDKTLTLWYVPLECVQSVLNTLRRECSEAVLHGHDEKADAILYSIKHIENDYQAELAEIARLEESEGESEEE